MERLAKVAITLMLLNLGSALGASTVAGQEESDVPVIEWDTNLSRLRVDNDDFVGQRFTLRCPKRVISGRKAVLSGTDIYTSDSALCFAAVHAGAVQSLGGIVTVQLNPGAQEYVGSERNGLVSNDFPGTRRSITFVPERHVHHLDDIQLKWAPRIRWDTKFTRTGLAKRTLVGQQFVLRCPAAARDLKPRWIYGTDSYAFDSFVCQAAVHAGRMTYLGGYVRVRIDESTSELRGSIRNGIESRSGGTGLRAISFPPLGCLGWVAPQ